ncbi:MAG: VanW family protein [Oscillospiraceae bacterium]|nr:VanW family protein [Oscillospiraceae bacterium]
MKGGEGLKKRKLFCEISPLCYKISVKKEHLLHDIKDLLSNEKFADTFDKNPFPAVIKRHSSKIVRKLHGVDIKLQENKRTNLRLAGEKINGIVINPGETFSFWKLVGEPTEKKGYLDGLVIKKGKIGKGTAGGLCQLANLIHWLILNSPLEVTEMHHHSDALFPDTKRRVPFGTGTSVCYKNLDYRFKNTTDSPVQIIIWQTEDELFGELRSTKRFPYIYRIIEENYGFTEEDGEFYRISEVYRLTLDKNKQIVKKETVLKNHSKVLYDYSLIPENQIITPRLRKLECKK